MDPPKFACWANLYLTRDFERLIFLKLSTVKGLLRDEKQKIEFGKGILDVSNLDLKERF